MIEWSLAVNACLRHCTSTIQLRHVDKASCTQDGKTMSLFEHVDQILPAQQAPLRIQVVLAAASGKGDLIHADF